MLRSDRIVRPCCVLLLLVATSSVASAAPFQHDQRAPRGLTAFRPQHATGYSPFQRTRIPEVLEEDPAYGPGIRVNGPGELDPSSEDDLIEMIVGRATDGTTLVLERSGTELSVWSTRGKQAGTALTFISNRSAPLAFGTADSLTLWVEWTSVTPGLAALQLRALEQDARLDRLLFHAFQGLVVCLGGEGQSPQIPVDSNHGSFVVGTELYQRGFDVKMADEDAVGADGNGSVYDEVLNAVQHRSIAHLAVFGYSHGGGSTYDLCDRLEFYRAGIGTFTIDFTSYVDGVENDSDTDLDRELRHPPTSAWHANHYQRGSFGDFFLDGGPVPVSLPPLTGLDVETTAWGSSATHFVVDDYGEVRDFIRHNLELRLTR